MQTHNSRAREFTMLVKQFDNTRYLRKYNTV